MPSYDPNVIMAGAGLYVTDYLGNKWSITNSKVTINGIVDQTTANVVELAYLNGVIWQRNSKNLWWGKSSTSAPWSPTNGTPTSPVAQSANNTIIVLPGYVITDVKGNAWSIINGKVVVNGVADNTTSRVRVLAYENGRIWQKNADGLWWSKAAPTDAWSPGYGTSVSPLPVSPNYAMVRQDGDVITDTAGRVWSMKDGKVLVDGVVDSSTNRVIELVYANGLIWQQNADHLWWSKSKPSNPWSPTAGTSVSPEGPLNKSWIGGAGQWADPGKWSPYGVPRSIDTVNLFGSNIALSNLTLPAGLIVRASSDSPPTLTVSGVVTSQASFQVLYYNLYLNVTANSTFANAGSMLAKGGMGNSTYVVSLGAGSVFSNRWTMDTAATSGVPTTGNYQLSGDGQFSNSGYLTITSGMFSATLTGNITNSGQMLTRDAGTIAIQFGKYADGAVGFVNKAGALINAAGSSTRINITSVKAGESRYGTFVNEALVQTDGGHIEIDAPVRQSATGRIVVNGGSVKLDHQTDGGTIEIKSGMLEFGGGSRYAYGPIGARLFNADVFLSGSSAVFDFGNSGMRTSVIEVLKTTSPTTADLIVSLPTGEQLADIRLVGRAYSPSDFQVSGATILYHPT